MALAAALPLAACQSAHILQEPATMNTEPSEHDFDFLVGHWRVEHRRLRERLAGCDEWQEFDGSCVMRKLLDGQGNVDDNLLNLPEGPYRAASLRAFDPATRRWAIWWLDARNPHTRDAPVVGNFRNGLGTFCADDTFKGQPIRIRYLWTDTQTPRPHWAQAFSADGGKTWETNWEMTFVRTPQAT
jgi:hypothetical protein